MKYIMERCVQPSNYDNYSGVITLSLYYHNIIERCAQPSNYDYYSGDITLL